MSWDISLELESTVSGLWEILKISFITPMDFMMDATTINTSYHIWTISTWHHTLLKPGGLWKQWVEIYWTMKATIYRLIFRNLSNISDGFFFPKIPYWLFHTLFPGGIEKLLGIFGKKNYFKDVFQSLKYTASQEWKHTIMITTFFNIRKQALTADLKMKEHFSEILILIYNMYHICEKSSSKQIKCS